MFKNPLTGKIAGFLREIGLEVFQKKIVGETFLPGILIENGKIFVDEDKLAFPGDLLHEAGHLAVIPGNLRNRLSDEVELPDFNMNSIESAAIAWSYAAALHLGLNPRVVFHENGYKGNSEGLLLGFGLGVFVGLNVLEEAGMSVSENAAKTLDISPYPQMIKWLAD